MKYEFYIFAYWHDPNWKKFVGASVKVWDLAKNLSSHGHKVTIFLPKYNFEKNNIPFKVVEIPFFDLPFLRLISYNIFLLMSLFVRFVKETPEIIYVRRMTSIVPLIFAKFMKAKFFYEINDDPYPDKKYGGKVKKNNIRTLLSAKIDEINLIFCTKIYKNDKKTTYSFINFIPDADCIVHLYSIQQTRVFRSCRTTTGSG